MSYKLLDDRNYSLGPIREIPPWLLPAGALADSNNLIFDRPGIGRQRGGTTSIFAGSQTGHSTSIGWAYAQDISTIEELYGVNGKTGQVNSINKVTGAATVITSLGAADTIYGRGVSHFGFCVFPGRGNPDIYDARSVFVAGQTGSTTFTNTANASVVANGNSVTLTGSDLTSNLRVGGIVYMTDGTNTYMGRVTQIMTTKIFNVWPACPVAITAAADGLFIAPTRQGLSFSNAACAASWQGRLLWGGPMPQTISGTYAPADRRIAYSLLLTEHMSAGGDSLYGACFVAGQGSTTDGVDDRNWLDIPGSDPIVAMEPVDDNELLVLTTGGVVRILGQLASQTNDSSPGITFDESQMNTNAGCYSDLSVQRTPHGIFWASPEGIMLYAGGGRPPIDLTEGKWHTAWRDFTRGANFAVHGAAYVRNHYIISFASAGQNVALAFNIDNGTWAPMSNVDCLNGTLRPTDRSQCYVPRFWAQAGTAPTFVGGQIVRYDSLFAPDVWGQTKRDSDGNTINFSAITRSMTDDSHTQRILRRVGIDYQAEMPAASINLYGGARLDWTDTNGEELVLLGALSNTAALTVTGATNATPVVITTSAAHGLQDGDFVDVHAVLGNVSANGHYRVTVLSTTTFRLNGSKGSGAYTSGGDVKKITTHEFMGSTMDIGQANYFLITNSGTVNRFELHGLRLGVIEMPRGMGR